MARPRKVDTALPDAIMLRRQISVQQAANLVALHEDTFRKHFGHLIRRVGPRLERCVLGDVLAIGNPIGG